MAIQRYEYQSYYCLDCGGNSDMYALTSADLEYGQIDPEDIYIRDADHAAFVRDLEDRLRLLGTYVCDGCGCAAARFDEVTCPDCFWLPCIVPSRPMAAASLSQGMRALCGRKLLPEPEQGR